MLSLIAYDRDMFRSGLKHDKSDFKRFIITPKHVLTVKLVSSDSLCSFKISVSRCEL